MEHGDLTIDNDDLSNKSSDLTGANCVLTMENDDLSNKNSRRKFRSQTSDNMDRWKQSREEAERRERLEERRVEEKESEERSCRCVKR